MLRDPELASYIVIVRFSTGTLIECSNFSSLLALQQPRTMTLLPVYRILSTSRRQVKV